MLLMTDTDGERTRRPVANYYSRCLFRGDPILYIYVSKLLIELILLAFVVQFDEGAEEQTANTYILVLRVDCLINSLEAASVNCMRIVIFILWMRGAGHDID